MINLHYFCDVAFQLAALPTRIRDSLSEIQLKQLETQHVAMNLEILKIAVSPICLSSILINFPSETISKLLQ